MRRRVVDALAGDYRLVPVCIALALIWLFFAVTTDSFLSPRNLSNLSLQIVVTGVLALGLVLVMLIAEIDLSVAALSGVCSAIMAALIVEQGWSPVLAVVVAVGAGALFGAAQGTVVVFGAPSFVVTLGGSLALGGALLLLLPDAGQINLAETPIADVAGTYIPPALGWVLLACGLALAAVLRLRRLRRLRQGTRGAAGPRDLGVLLPTALAAVAAIAILNSYRGVPVAVAIFLGLLVALWYLGTQTRFGTYLYAVGGNVEAARRAGINVPRLRVVTFALAGGFAAIAGIIAASRLLGVSTQSGSGTLLLQAIAAAVIGGASLFGGRGSIWAALLGALVIGSVSNGLDLRGSPDEVKLIVQGAILVLAVAIDAVVSRGSLLPRNE
jgi:D-xylose transport system permease protein